MKCRKVVSIAFGIAALSLVAGLTICAVYVGANESAWRQQGRRFSAAKQLAVDLGLWWNLYWWVVVLGAIQFLVAILVFRIARKWLTRQPRSDEERDYGEGLRT
jgi:hypothetical protein